MIPVKTSMPVIGGLPPPFVDDDFVVVGGGGGDVDVDAMMFVSSLDFVEGTHNRNALHRTP